MNRLLNYMFTLFLAVLSSVSLYSQDKGKDAVISVSGRVTDSNREPMSGVVVFVKGTSNGTLTAADGTYFIRVRRGQILEYSMLGYAAEEHAVDGRTTINVILKEDAQMLQEAIVEVGYGEQRLIDVTGTVSRVNMEDMIKAPVITFDQALQGRVAGVSITSADGQPGQEMSIVIRGANSLTQSNSPLYVVDGFPMENFPTSAISSNDIASITVLKDASSTAIYGSRAANGVIIIETKKGRLGSPTVTYNGTYGFQQVTKTMELMNAYEFVSYQLERSNTSATYDYYLTDRGMTLDDYKKVKAIDWQDKVFRTAPMHMKNLSVIGGNNETRYSVSGSLVNQKGVIVNSGYHKYSGRMSLEQQLRPKLTLSANASYSEDKTHGQTSSAQLSDNSGYTTYLMYRTWAYKPILMDSQSLEDLFDDDIETMGIGNTVMNPLVSNMNEQIYDKKIIFHGNGNIKWDITDDLTLRVRGGYSKHIRRQEAFNNSKTYQGYPSVNNSKDVNAAFKEIIYTSWLEENTLTWKKNYAGRHKFELLGGFTLQGTDSSIYGFTTIKIPNEYLGLSGMDDGLPETTLATLSGNRLMSGLARVNYSFKDRYLLTASAREDGSSKFTKGNRWGFFPSGAVAWRFSNEEWMQGLGWLDEGKLRLSYGVTGNNRVGDFSAYGSMELGDHYAIDNVIAPCFVPSNLGNSDLTWESTAQADLGLDLYLLDGRLIFTADVYRKTTSNLLLEANIPYSSGYSTVYKNVGKVRNDGLELTLSTVNVRTRNFIWTSDFNIAFNRDKVLELAEGEEALLSKVSFTGGDYKDTYLYITQVGKPMSSFYGLVWDGVYGYEDFNVTSAGGYILKEDVPANGNARSTVRPGDIKYVDQNKDGDVTDADMVVIGRTRPIHTGGLNNNFTWKSVSLNVFFQWSYGNQLMNANRIIFEGNIFNRNINQFKTYVDRWSEDNPGSKNHRVGGGGPSGRYSTRTLEDGSFLRLKTAQLSYAFPKKLIGKIGLSELQLFISGQNLFTLTSYTGMDPEVSTRHSALTPGFDYSSYARNRIYTGGVNITF